MVELGPFERALINRLQGGFPLSERPFDLAARTLGGDEATLIGAISRLLEQGWLSRFGPLYNAERLGGELLLAALAVPEGSFDWVAALLERMPEVAHNYRRQHRLNMWFVLATENTEATRRVLEGIEQTTGLKVYSFPKQREYYLGLWFLIGEDGRLSTRSFATDASDGSVHLDELDRRIIQATQAGLPLVPAPLAVVARSASCATCQVIDRMEQMLASGVIRRIGVVPNHYRLGFRGNGMSVWDVPDAQLDRVGQRLGALDFVSHCYARPRHTPDWPYNLFAMVHGRDRDEVLAKVAGIPAWLGTDIGGYEVLFSSAVLKKTGLRLPV
jgi:siroheme decarboxylase